MKAYMIMVSTNLNVTENGIPDLGDERIVGFYIDKEEAFKNVKENDNNINNTYYNYALIEEVEEGLQNPAGCSSRWFFKYNKDTGEYDEIEEPACLTGFSGFTIG